MQITIALIFAIVFFLFLILSIYGHWVGVPDAKYGISFFTFASGACLYCWYLNRKIFNDGRYR